MRTKRKLTAAEADLQMMKLRRENLVAHHKATQEEWKVRRLIKEAENIKNMQNQYGTLLEAHSRLPLGLQGEALTRMRDFKQLLTSYAATYPSSMPLGPDPYQQTLQRRRRDFT